MICRKFINLYCLFLNYSYQEQNSMEMQKHNLINQNEPHELFRLKWIFKKRLFDISKSCLIWYQRIELFNDRLIIIMRIW